MWNSCEFAYCLLVQTHAGLIFLSCSTDTPFGRFEHIRMVNKLDEVLLNILYSPLYHALHLPLIFSCCAVHRLCSERFVCD